MKALLSRLGNLVTTLLALLALALGVAASYLFSAAGPWPVVAPLALLAVNLLAAIVTRPVFRRQVPLLAFHLALLALVILVALGRLTRLDGWVEVSQGEVFDGTLDGGTSGPWHAGDLSSIRFVNEGFVIEYAPEMQRGRTLNRVRWWDRRGREQVAVIGDHRTLPVRGYRFRTTHNKGFAPTFRWQPRDGGVARVGTVHLPSYPLRRFEQAQRWTPPGSGSEVWMMLDLGETVIDPRSASTWKVPDEYTLVVRTAGRRETLRPGDALELPDGRLTLLELRSWMGYTVTYDWTLPWLFAACAVAVLCLAWHLWSKSSGAPWLQPDRTATASVPPSAGTRGKPGGAPAAGA